MRRVLSVLSKILFILVISLSLILSGCKKQEVTSKTTFEPEKIKELKCDIKEFDEVLCKGIIGEKECKEKNNCAPYCQDLCKKDNMNMKFSTYTYRYQENGAYLDFCKCSCEK